MLIAYLITVTLILFFVSSVGRTNKEYDKEIHSLYRQEKWKKDNKIY